MGESDIVDGSWPSAPVGRVAAPLREQVVSTLRAAILDFQLKPGQRLVERELIERLGVSRTTVREALRDLSSEGLVTVLPQRGAVVSVPSLEEAIDLYEIRAVLEPLLIRHFVERVGDDEIDDLATAVDGLERTLTETDDVREILSAKDEFYKVLVRGARSLTLQQLLDGIKARVQMLRATSLTETGRPQMVVLELRAVVDAVRAKDAALAALLCANHVRAAADTALRMLGAEIGPFANQPGVFSPSAVARWSAK